MLLRGLPRGFDVRDVEYAPLIVNVAVRTENQVVCRMVGVGGVDPVHDPDTDVGDVIAIRVLEINEVGCGGHDYATVPELETGRVVNLGKGNGLVSYTVAILIG